MSLNSGNFWSFTMLRLRTLLQLFNNTADTSAAAAAARGGGGGRRRRLRRPSHLPKPSSVAMVPYRSCKNENSICQMFRSSFGSTTYLSSLRSYFSRMKLNHEKDQPTTTPFSFFFPGWVKWIFGSLLALLVPSWKQSWNKFQTLEEEAEMVIEEAENVAEVVEKVAELTEKVSAEIAEKLPDKSKLKQAAHVVENCSKEIAHDAHLTQHILHKVDEWKEKLDKSETAVNEQIKKNEGIAHK